MITRLLKISWYTQKKDYISTSTSLWKSQLVMQKQHSSQFWSQAGWRKPARRTDLRQLTDDFSHRKRSLYLSNTVKTAGHIETRVPNTIDSFAMARMQWRRKWKQQNRLLYPHSLVLCPVERNLQTYFTQFNEKYQEVNTDNEKVMNRPETLY